VTVDWASHYNQSCIRRCNAISNGVTAGADECPQQLLCATEEVEHFLLTLDKSKAMGPDVVSATMLKCTATSIAPSVTLLFNLAIPSGKVPTEWKQSLVASIPKSSDLSSPNNYCPISLLSILSKLLEWHIHMLITTHLTENHILSDAHWGFSAGKGTVTALLDTTHRWLEMLDNGRMFALYFLTTVRRLTRFHTALSFRHSYKYCSLGGRLSHF